MTTYKINYNDHTIGSGVGTQRWNNGAKRFYDGIAM